MECDNDIIKYRSQGDYKELEVVSSKMKEVEGTANSRFLFRRYEIIGGTVKVDGTNIRTITQNSLRVMIGVVLQAMQKSICEMIRVVPQSYKFVEQHPLTNITFGKRDTVTQS